MLLRVVLINGNNRFGKIKVFSQNPPSKENSKAIILAVQAVDKPPSASVNSLSP